MSDPKFNKSKNNHDTYSDLMSAMPSVPTHQPGTTRDDPYSLKSLSKAPTYSLKNSDKIKELKLACERLDRGEALKLDVDSPKLTLAERHRRIEVNQWIDSAWNEFGKGMTRSEGARIKELRAKVDSAEARVDNCQESLRKAQAELSETKKAHQALLQRGGINTHIREQIVESKNDPSIRELIKAHPSFDLSRGGQLAYGDPARYQKYVAFLEEKMLPKIRKENPQLLPAANKVISQAKDVHKALQSAVLKNQIRSCEKLVGEKQKDYNAAKSVWGRVGKEFDQQVKTALLGKLTKLNSKGYSANYVVQRQFSQMPGVPENEPFSTPRPR